MKIKVVVPNSSEEFTATQIAMRKKATAHGNEIDVGCLRHGPTSIESCYDEAIAAPYIVEEAQKAQNEGYDAITLDCAMDPCLRAIREVLRIPVTSGGEASFLLAMALGRKFSVITVLESTAQAIKDNLNKYGFQSRVASVRYANIPVLELGDKEAAARAILNEARKAIKEDGAHVIVLGCTGMSALQVELQKQLGIPIVDPAVAAIKLAEVLYQMGLVHSKADFVLPEEKEIR